MIPNYPMSLSRVKMNWDEYLKVREWHTGNYSKTPSDMGHYIEIRIADTWTDHIRQHEYVTKNVQAMEDRIRALIKDCPLPIISHYRGKSPLK